MRVELTALVAGDKTDLGKVTERHELDVEGVLTKWAPVTVPSGCESKDKVK